MELWKDKWARCGELAVEADGRHDHQPGNDAAANKIPETREPMM